ncbi:MAG: 4Fe-4S binding protein [Thermoanaerobacter sp.]|nr:4Fe-4S binding protein [Thermoanaerobacter sp.]
MVEHCPGSSLWTIDLGDESNQPRITVLAGMKGASLPLNCRHCAEPACVDACPTGAMLRDKTTGLVRHRADRCVGCWMCVMACPTGALSLVEISPQ